MGEVCYLDSLPFKSVKCRVLHSLALLAFSAFPAAAAGSAAAVWRLFMELPVCPSVHSGCTVCPSVLCVPSARPGWH